MRKTSPSDRPELLDRATIIEWMPEFHAGDIADLLHRWCLLAEDGAPPRSMIDPLSMPRLLPVLAIMEFAEEAGDWRYALVGEEVRQMIGGAVKGRLLRDVLGQDEDSRRVRALYDESAKLARPTITFGVHTVGFGTHREFARLLFPYRDKSPAITTLLLLLVYL